MRWTTVGQVLDAGGWIEPTDDPGDPPGHCNVHGLTAVRLDTILSKPELNPVPNPEFARLFDAAVRRRAVIRQLAARRASLGLSQTAVAARMSTSQPVVARLESGDLDSRLSTIERYAAAVGLEVELVVREPIAGVAAPRLAERTDTR